MSIDFEKSIVHTCCCYILSCPAVCNVKLKYTGASSYTGEKILLIHIKVPNYNEKLRSSVTVQEFFFASFEFSPSEFKRSNASTSTDYIWSCPVHCSRAPRCTDSDCHHHSLTSQLAVGINLTMSFVCLSNKYFQRAEGRIFNFIISVES